MGAERPLVPAGEGLRAYYRSKIEQLELLCRQKQHDLHRMEAQRNELNSKGGPDWGPLAGTAAAASGAGGGWPLCLSASRCNGPHVGPHVLALQCGCSERSCSCCRSRAATWARSSRWAAGQEPGAAQDSLLGALRVNDRPSLASPRSRHSVVAPRGATSAARQAQAPAPACCTQQPMPSEPAPVIPQCLPCFVTAGPILLASGPPPRLAALQLMGKNKVLVKVNPEGKYVVDLGESPRSPAGPSLPLFPLFLLFRLPACCIGSACPAGCTPGQQLSAW